MSDYWNEYDWQRLLNVKKQLLNHDYFRNSIQEFSDLIDSMRATNPELSSLQGFDIESILQLVLVDQQNRSSQPQQVLLRFRKMMSESEYSKFSQGYYKLINELKTP